MHIFSLCGQMPIMCWRLHLCIMYTTLQVSDTFSLLKQWSAVPARLSSGRDVRERCGSVPPVTSHAHLLTRRTCSTLPIMLHHDAHGLSRTGHPLWTFTQTRADREDHTGQADLWRLQQRGKLEHHSASSQRCPCYQRTPQGRGTGVISVCCCY